MEKLSFKLHGQYVQMDPQEWRDQYNLTINVGIGTGDQVQQAMMLQSITQAQFALMQSPFAYLVQPQNIYASLTRQAENAGFKNPGEFYSDPKTVQPPPPQPDPKTALEQMKLQADAQKFQATMQMDAHKFRAETQMRMQVDASKQEYEARQKQLEIEQQAQLEAVKAQYEDQARREQLAFDEWKTRLEAEVKLIIADKQAAAPAVAESAPREDKEEAAEVMRDMNGEISGIAKAGSLYRVDRDEIGRLRGLQPLPMMAGPAE
jgi:hypothetical protein